jgi:hypothetical protein
MKKEKEKPKAFKAILSFKPKGKKEYVKVKLTLSRSHPKAFGNIGVLLYEDTPITGIKFQELVNKNSAYIETNDPIEVCRALGLAINNKKIIKI